MDTEVITNEDVRQRQMLNAMVETSRGQLVEPAKQIMSAEEFSLANRLARKIRKPLWGKRLKIHEYFRAHPGASPHTVRKMFNATMGNVYSYRREVHILLMAEGRRWCDLDAFNRPGPALGTKYSKRAKTMRKRAKAIKPEASKEGVRDLSRGKQEGGSHYVDMGLQPWDVVATWSKAEQIGYYRGTALSYVMRAGAKGSTKDDVKKAIHVLERLSETL